MFLDVVCKVGKLLQFFLAPSPPDTKTNKAFVELFENSGIAGVQLFPEDIQVLILLFADDIALISDTVVRFQWQLHFLRYYCLDSKLVVNVVKQKWWFLRRVGEYRSMKDGIMMVAY